VNKPKRCIKKLKSSLPDLPALDPDREIGQSGFFNDFWIPQALQKDGGQASRRMTKYDFMDRHYIKKQFTDTFLLFHYPGISFL